MSTYARSLIFWISLIRRALDVVQENSFCVVRAKATGRVLLVFHVGPSANEQKR